MKTEHPLLANATVRPYAAVPQMPSSAQYDPRRGCWMVADQPLIRVDTAFAKHATKKCDQETGEDQIRGMKPKVLIFSSIYDFSVDMLALALERKGVEYFRLNKESLPSHALYFCPKSRVLTISDDDKRVECVAELHGIFFRQPVFLRNTPNVPLSVQEQMERSQWAAFGRSLSVLRAQTWMNWPQATYLAQCKPYQLSIASQAGFRVPHTFVTNDTRQPELEASDQWIIKSLDTALFLNGENCLFTYSTQINTETLRASDASSAPLLIQTSVENKVDVRVTVVEPKVFAVKILAAGNPILGDWRTHPRENLEYVDVHLPDSIQSACLRLTTTLGLEFAAIDLLQTDDEFVFLEVNPTGEWGWLQSDSRDIAGAIADRIVSK